MAALLPLSAILLFVTSANAFTAVEPNCTIPFDNVTFVSSPQVRGTMDIIWSCFSVLLICTWSVQHLSVPVHKESKSRSWNRALWEKARFNVTKLKWMGISIIAPEFILGKTLTEHLAANESRRQFSDKAWTTTHGYFANMRGFVLRFDVAAVQTDLTPSKPDKHIQSRLVPRPDGNPPYREQNLKRAQATELEHCRQFCGEPCPHRETVPPDEANKTVSSPLLSLQMHSSQQTNSGEPQETKSGVWEQPMVARIETNKDLLTPRDSPDHWSECLQANSTPSTLVNPTPTTPVDGQGFSTKDTSNTPIDDRGFSRNNTTITLVEELGPLSPSPAKSVDRPQAIELTRSLTASEMAHVKWKGTWALSSIQMLYAYQKGIIAQPPTITAEELNDRSKSDALVKSAAVIQITWLVIQILARAFQNLAITLLEVTVLAFAACSVATYFLLWHKPQDVQVPVYIDAKDILTQEQVIGLAARSPVSTLMVHEFWLHGVAIRAMADSVFPWTRGLAFRTPWMGEPIFLNPHLTGIGFGGTLFGAIHFVAWNFEFPTSVERLLWRISCSTIVVFPLLGSGLYVATQHFARRSIQVKDKPNLWLRPICYAVGLVYLSARLYLLVEVFRSLAYAPMSTFQEVDWPSAIPHVN